MHLWPLLAAGLFGLWALTGHSPHALGGVMALLIWMPPGDQVAIGVVL